MTVSNTSSTRIPRHERVKLTYLKWQKLYETEKPYQVFLNLKPGIPSTNLVFENDEYQEIVDVRGQQDRFNLDKNGFEYITHESKVKAFDSQDEIESVYLPETEEIIRKHVKNVDRLLVFDYRIRRNANPSSIGDIINLSDKLQHLLPGTQVHIDTSPLGVSRRVRFMCGEDAEKLLKGRVRIINVWRPIKHHIEDWPLALCDGNTLEGSDLIPCDHVTEKFATDTIYPLRNPRQKWYYLNRQTPEEVILFKNFDSAEDVEAIYSPHSSFEHNDIPPNSLPRESIEVRVIVFSENTSGA